MFDKAKATLASLFGQLADIQKDIDDSARTVVEGIVAMIDVVDDEAPSSRDALTGRDFSWYQDVASTLMREGFLAPIVYEPRAWMSRPVESRTIVEYALGDSGTIAASWFALGGMAEGTELHTITLFTAFQDGSTLETLSGGTASASSLPQMHDEREQRLPEGAPVGVVLARHRAGIAAYAKTPQSYDSVAAYHTSRHEQGQRRAAFRRGLGLSLVERYLEARFTGDEAEVGEAYLDAVRKHPEWYKYADTDGAEPPTPTDAAPVEPAPSMPLTYMMSQTDDGRRTLSTFGLLFSGLPELLMTGVAANHSRAARVLAGTVASGIGRSRTAATNDAEFLEQLVSEDGVRITLTRADALAARVTQVSDSGNNLPVDVHLTLRGFDVEDEPSLLHVNPLPDIKGSFDERLREACARFGVEVPAARGAESADDAMREAHERAVMRLGEVRARWSSRAAAGEKVLVKYRASQGGHGEYVWLEVREWRDGVLDGEVVTPAPRVGVSLGQVITIEQALVYDQMVMGPSGSAVPALTDVVATDYGMDI